MVVFGDDHRIRPENDVCRFGKSSVFLDRKIRQRTGTFDCWEVLAADSQETHVPELVATARRNSIYQGQQHAVLTGVDVPLIERQAVNRAQNLAPPPAAIIARYRAVKVGLALQRAWSGAATTCHFVTVGRSADEAVRAWSFLRRNARCRAHLSGASERRAGFGGLPR